MEIYSAEELKEVNKSKFIWRHYFEDPLEPAKSWSRDAFSQVYSKPGFHFMIARTAQIGQMSRDPKLPSLQSKLSSRWSCPVDFATMEPRQDWMLCTIPDCIGPRAEILSAAIIRLLDGNASYIVRHFAPPSRIRELEITVKGSNADAGQIFNQLKRKQLSFESSGVSLGWRVSGIRKTDVVSKYRGTFILDSPSTFWSWAIHFDHAHGSIPPTTPFLDFEPGWVAKKPYACQLCYCSDHSSLECPLPFIKLGGVSLVSHSSRTMVLHKKAAERVFISDRVLKPAPLRPSAPQDIPPPIAPLPDIPYKGKGRAALSAISEVPSDSQCTQDIGTFITYKLADRASSDDTAAIVDAAIRSERSLISTIQTLIPRFPILAWWDENDALAEFESWIVDRNIDVQFLSSDVAMSPTGLPPSGLAEPTLPPVNAPASDTHSDSQRIRDIESFIGFKVADKLSFGDASAIVDAAHNSGQSFISTVRALIPRLPILAKWDEVAALQEFESWVSNRDLDIPLLSSDIATPPAGRPPSELAVPALPPVVTPASACMSPTILSPMRLMPLRVMPLRL